MSKPLANNPDQAWFENLFKAHYGPLCNYAYQFVQDLDSAKDITQKVFIYLWENREKIDPQKSIPSYLFTAVKNRCLNFIRDHKKYRSQVLDLDIVAQEISFEPEDFSTAGLQEKIAEALQKLPEKCRLVFEMSRFQNKKYQDIAAELNISVKTVEAHMSRALKSLREQLKDHLHLLWFLLFF